MVMGVEDWVLSVTGWWMIGHEDVCDIGFASFVSERLGTCRMGGCMVHFLTDII